MKALPKDPSLQIHNSISTGGRFPKELFEDGSLEKEDSVFLY